jgi:methionyl-tRNA formyltransferase
MGNKLRIVFYGTPEFAVQSLENTVNGGYDVAAVVTAPDKPAGRGLKLKSSPVKEFAVRQGIPVLQPSNLKDPVFLDQLKKIQPNLQVVVAFRMLPREVWSLPPHGTFNLHASLLPQYRGAAPINWAVINGEQRTGVTTFFLDEAIDTGKIIFTEETEIAMSETAGELHDRLKTMGAELVVKTLEAIESGSVQGISQGALTDPKNALRKAPKIKTEDCRFDWDNPVVTIYNRIRGLSPHPGAHAVLRTKSGEDLLLKIFRAESEPAETLMEPGEYVTDGKTFLKVAAKDGFVSLRELQLTGHRVMAIADFLNGFRRRII